MSQTIWKVNGLEFELDLTDADTMDRFEESFKRLEKTEAKLVKTGKSSDIIRQYCDMFYTLFDEIFGEGTGNDLFGGKKSAAVCENVYEDFIEFTKNQNAQMHERHARLFPKYAPNKSNPQPYYSGKNKHRR